MKHRETLDEAIDRVAAQMSADGAWQGVDLPELPPRGFIAGWGSWRWAVVAVGVLFLATVLVVLGPDRRNAEVETAQSVQPSEPLRGGGDPPVAARVPPQDAHVMTIAPRQAPARASRARAAAQPVRTERVSWVPEEPSHSEIDSIVAPAAIDVAPVSVPALYIAETEPIEPVTIPGIRIGASSESPMLREQ